MKNKHPEVNHPGPQSNRRKKMGDQLSLPYGMESDYDQPSMVNPYDQNLAQHGLSALLGSNQNSSLSAINASALSQLLQAGLLNSQNNSGNSLNLFGNGNGLNRGTFPMHSMVTEEVEDDEDDDGPLVIACEDDSGDDSVEGKEF